MPNSAGERVYAGFFVRLAAYLIDWMIVGAALLVIRIPVWIASLGGADFILKDFIFHYSLYDMVLYALKITYFILLTYYTGATLGKKLLHIRVISTEDRKPTFFEILFRESVGKFLSGLVLEIGYLMIGLEKNKCGLHDILSDTYVVYQHQKTVAVPAPVAYRPAAYQTPPYGSNGTMPQQNHMPPYGSNGTVPQQNHMPPYGSNGTVPQQNHMPPYGSNGTTTQNHMPLYDSHETMPPQISPQMPSYGSNGTIPPQDSSQMPSYEGDGTGFPKNQNQMHTGNEAGFRQNQMPPAVETASRQKPNETAPAKEDTTF